MNISSGFNKAKSRNKERFIHEKTLTPPPEKIKRMDPDSNNNPYQYPSEMFGNIFPTQPIIINSTNGSLCNSNVYQTPSPDPNYPVKFINKKMDTSKHYHIFVGDLAPEIESKVLLDAFSNFGFVTECKIIKDMHTQKPKGYGFVAYATKEEAELAIQMMNGQIIGSRIIRTGWAVRKPNAVLPKDQKPLNYSEVMNASSTSNCTVYVGGITKGLTEDALRDAFGEFGEILEVRVFKDKGYSFLRFDTHEAATKAIITMHGNEVVGQPCKCSWGKESSDVTSGSIQSYIASLSKQAMMLGHFSLMPNLPTLTNPGSNYNSRPNLTPVSSIMPNNQQKLLPNFSPSKSIQMLPPMQSNSSPNQAVCLRSINQTMPTNSPFINTTPKSASNIVMPGQNPMLYQNSEFCNFFGGHPQSIANQSQILSSDLILQNNCPQQTFSAPSNVSMSHISNFPSNIFSLAGNSHEFIQFGSGFIPIKSQ